jgi:hypothetical protein
MNYDENKPVRMAFDITQQRVEHYSGVISYMVKAEIARCQTEENFTPSPEQIRFYEKELIRHMTIRRNIDGAQKIRISKSNLLLT